MVRVRRTSYVSWWIMHWEGIYFSRDDAHSYIFAIFVSAMYKRDPASGEVLSSPGDEYYDDSVLFKGAYPSFVNQIVEVSNALPHFIFWQQYCITTFMHFSFSFLAEILKCTWMKLTDFEWRYSEHHILSSL